ncbi:MAG: large conductance mechanosensitive channel protein MscL [Lautropia sp.]|nr:large conductance mechanosensitive channel protein MscL [Lautropia sp.]
MSMMSEFREFALKGNVVDLAVGVIIGGAFGKIVDSLVKDIVMPIVGAVFGGFDFSNYFIILTSKVPENIPLTYDALNKAGVPLFAYGNFLTVFINFLILAFIIFQMIRLYTKAQKAFIKEKPVEETPATPEDIVLLREIRDELKNKA